MRKIVKSIEPDALTIWKRQHPQGRYADLSNVERLAIRQACLTEQYYLCAYCCKAVGYKPDDCMNEHVEAQDIAPQRVLDFNNIVVSCRTPNQCDAAHGSQPLPLTPFMAECETELKFKLSGRVEGLTKRAKDAITVLNLGESEQSNRSLVEKRKQLVSSLLMVNGVDPDDGLEDDELINLVIADIQQPKDGKLEAYAPVVVNILSQWLS